MDAVWLMDTGVGEQNAEDSRPVAMIRMWLIAEEKLSQTQEKVEWLGLGWQDDKIRGFNLELSNTEIRNPNILILRSRWIDAKFP